MSPAQSPDSVEQFPLATKRAAFAQIVVCASGCCCGRVDKGKPAVPVAWLKAQWRTRRLNPRVQLTIAECLGPCDLVNVVAIHAEPESIWLGGLVATAHFEALLEWATASHGTGQLQPLPDDLKPFRFHRFSGEGTSVPLRVATVPATILSPEPL